MTELEASALEALLKDLESKADDMIFITKRPWEWGYKEVEPNYLAATNPVTVKKLIAVIRTYKDQLLDILDVEQNSCCSHCACWLPESCRTIKTTLEDCEKIIRGELTNGTRVKENE